ncbi:MAG: SufE family protein, partial [Paludibacter sp.]|nr:SufE family protein [Paludibacter sp.]
MTINEIQDEIIEEFNQFDDWLDRYSLLIDYGNALPPMDEKYKKPENIIEGCQSRVWLNAELENGCVIFSGQSDAVLVKGIVALLINVLNNHTP